MSFAEHIERVRREAEGDSYFQLFMAKLREGHTIQQVEVVARGGEGSDAMIWYRFLLARLGMLVNLDVPAGSLAIERYLVQARIKMANPQNERFRSFVRMGAAVRPLLIAASRDVARAALLQCAERIGAPESLTLARSLVVAARPSGEAVDALAGILEAQFDQELSRLALDLEYGWETGSPLVDQALRDLIASLT